MLLSVVELRALFETDLDDDALQLLLNSAEQEIVQHAGAHASQSDNFVEPRSRFIFLERKAASITTVTERIGNTETVLNANDYRSQSPQELMRRDDGANPRAHWGDHVKVDYVPVSDTDTRKRVQADLIKLAAQYNATRSISVGDYSEQSPEYQDERKNVLSQLGGGWIVR